MVRIHPIPVGRTSPREKTSTLQFCLPPPAHPVRDQRPFVFGHGSPNLHDQLFVRVIAEEGTIDELDRAAHPLQLLQNDHLMDVIAR